MRRMRRCSPRKRLLCPNRPRSLATSMATVPSSMKISGTTPLLSPGWISTSQCFRTPLVIWPLPSSTLVAEINPTSIRPRPDDLSSSWRRRRAGCRTLSFTWTSKFHSAGTNQPPILVPRRTSTPNLAPSKSRLIRPPASPPASVSHVCSTLTPIPR